MFYQFARFLLSVVFHIVFNVKAEGKENLPKRGGYILASNHRTDMDPVFIGISILKTLTFMAKIELFQLPLVGFIFHWVGAFPVERGKGDTGAVDFAIKTVNDGKALAMFPEGTRSRDGTLKRPKSGCAVIAAASNATVVPVAVCYGERLHFREKIIVRFGVPISPQELAVRADSPASIKAGSRLIMSKIKDLLGEYLREVKEDEAA